jgi:hypothetical protein
VSLVHSDLKSAHIPSVCSRGGVTARRGPPQIFVCVDTSPRPDPVPLHKGRIYTVSAVAVDDAGAIGLGVEEAHPGDGFTHFFADRFRPLRDSDIDVFRRMLTPLDERVP